jgi:hypothetical protein
VPHSAAHGRADYTQALTGAGAPASQLELAIVEYVAWLDTTRLHSAPAQGDLIMARATARSAFDRYLGLRSFGSTIFTAR